jgi:hypothetical protein
LYSNAAKLVIFEGYCTLSWFLVNLLICSHKFCIFALLATNFLPVAFKNGKLIQYVSILALLMIKRQKLQKWMLLILVAVLPVKAELKGCFRELNLNIGLFFVQKDSSFVLGLLK